MVDLNDWAPVSLGPGGDLDFGFLVPVPSQPGWWESLWSFRPLDHDVHYYLVADAALVPNAGCRRRLRKLERRYEDLLERIRVVQEFEELSPVRRPEFPKAFRLVEIVLRDGGAGGPDSVFLLFHSKDGKEAWAVDIEDWDVRRVETKSFRDTMDAAKRLLDTIHGPPTHWDPDFGDIGRSPSDEGWAVRRYFFAPSGKHVHLELVAGGEEPPDEFRSRLRELARRYPYFMLELEPRLVRALDGWLELPADATYDETLFLEGITLALPGTEDPEVELCFEPYADRELLIMVELDEWVPGEILIERM